MPPRTQVKTPRMLVKTPRTELKMLRTPVKMLRMLVKMLRMPPKMPRLLLFLKKRHQKLLNRLLHKLMVYTNMSHLTHVYALDLQKSALIVSTVSLIHAEMNEEGEKYPVLKKQLILFF